MGFVRGAAQWVARNAVRRAPAVDAFLGSLDQVEKIKALTDAIMNAATYGEAFLRPSANPRTRVFGNITA